MSLNVLLILSLYDIVVLNYTEGNSMPTYSKAILQSVQTNDQLIEAIKLDYSDYGDGDISAYDVQDENGTAYKEIWFPSSSPVQAENAKKAISNVELYWDKPYYKLVLTEEQAQNYLASKITEEESSDEETDDSEDNSQLAREINKAGYEAKTFDFYDDRNGRIYEMFLVDKNQAGIDSSDDSEENSLLAREINEAGYEAKIFDCYDGNGGIFKIFSFVDKSQAGNFARNFSNTAIETLKYHKVMLSIEQVQSLQQQLKDRETFLATTNFSKSLEGFEIKASLMRNKGKDNVCYANAQPIALQFCKDLKDASKKYLQTGDKHALQTECRKLCSAAKDSALKDHREWKGAIAKFVTDVLSTLTCGLLNLSMFTRTDTVKKLDDFEQTVVNRITGS